ncbi:hypothetical protein NC653_034871 [Populus alba x Populus x berolinensis]|uniref:Uncharacterized protein n=1 Tax=Populus alba x Populus x berolinensis TaxID=444605 RepID=A0AAD6LNI0_9ROSI|nr:hypothetical protein NC653_034871 [Populus alba x Populus x berolinensis]
MKRMQSFQIIPQTMNWMVGLSYRPACHP